MFNMLRFILAGTSSFALSSAALAGTLAEDAKAFGTREAVSDIAINKSGTKVAMLAAGPGTQTRIDLADVNSGQIVNLTKSEGNPQAFRSCEFDGDAYLVCYHSGVEPYDKYLFNFSGLVAIATDGSKMRSLREKSLNNIYISGADGAVVDWLPDDDGAVLLARYRSEQFSTGTLLGSGRSGVSVDRVDLGNLKFTTVQQPRQGATNFMTDGRGNIRFYWLDPTDRFGQITGETKFRYRTRNSNDWKEFGVVDKAGNGPLPVAVDPATDSAYVLERTNGRDALYSVKLDGSMARTLIASNPAVDIDSVIRLGPGDKVIGYSFADDRRQNVYFDPEYARLQRSLAKAIPNLPLIDFVGATPDGNKIIVLASGDTHAGTFYLFDKSSKHLSELAKVRPELGDRALAPVKPIQIPAADGVQIPAYLTLPPGHPGGKLPAIVMPHGGPEARDEWRFDWLPQFLAARGFAVIQPNFRGSAGYGEQWLAQNGFKNWRTSIGDVNSAGKYLIDQGIADPDRLAILGWSYGGYAALQSSVVAPDLYKAIVAIAPVTDLTMIKEEARDFADYRFMKDYVGSGPHVAEGSPLRRAAEIKSPVLLVHGDHDVNVSVPQSDRMAAALKSAGKQVEYLRFDRLDHYLDDSNARIQMLTKIGQFLEATLSK